MTKRISGKAPASVKEQIKEIEELMRKNRYACAQNPELQANYRRLLAIRGGDK